MNTTPHSSWFYAQDNQQKGPVSFSELQELVQNGLPDSSLVWTEGMANWVPVSSIPEFTQSVPPSGGIQAASPYAPPASNVLPVQEYSLKGYDLPAQPIPLDVSYCLRQGWKYTLANFSKVFVLGLCYFLISMIISAVFGIVGGGMNEVVVSEGSPVTIDQEFSLIGLITSLAESVISIWLSLGVVRYGHSLLNGEDPQIGLLFSQGSKLVSAVVASFLFYLMFLIGLVLLVVPGVIIAARFSFFTQAIVEKDLGAIDSLKYSWELTKDNTLSLIGLFLLSMLVVIAGVLAVFVGLLWALPTTWLALLIAFRYLHRGANAVTVLP